MLYELIYTSLASKEMNPDDLKSILEISRANNEASDITGILMYHNRTFIQLLEGPKEEVLSTYERIKNDDRHSQVNKFWDNDIEKRNFDSWSMAFSELKDAEGIDSEYISFFTENGFDAELLNKKPSIGQELLLSLKETL